MGNTTMSYHNLLDGSQVQHHGAANTIAVLDYLTHQHLTMDKFLLMGSSAG